MPDKTSKEWFSADREGLRALMLGKPKWYAIREILANCWDEQGVTQCKIDAKFGRGKAMFVIIDNSSIGFRDLKDSFTLFKDTYKRPDAMKRGRFNVGEKQAFAICEKAIINTTTGTIVFDKTGRHESRASCARGTSVTLYIEMTLAEFDEIIETLQMCIPPDNIQTYLNGTKLLAPTLTDEFKAKLQTEVLSNGQMTKTVRETAVTLYKKDFDDEPTYIYEMGIPVCKIDCDYSIDVSQRVPMGIDRDTVSQAYLRDLFAEVLNHTYNALKPEQSSAIWVRKATEDDRIKPEAIRAVANLRWGDKVCSATPGDPVSVDDAISNKYKVVSGREMSQQEWEKFKAAGAMPSSHQLFGHGVADSLPYEPTAEMLWVAALAKKIMTKLYGIDIAVRFVSCAASDRTAEFGNDTLTFNVSRLGKSFFSKGNLRNVLALLVHENCHHFGHHTEHIYHEKICDMAGALTSIALCERHFFD